jgi:hypothetical protein
MSEQPEGSSVVKVIPATRAKAKKRARLESGEALAEAKKGLRAAQAEVKHERKARIKAEKALVKAQQALAAARLVAKQERPAREMRVSFIVQLMVDEHGQPRRTEIEDAKSGRKQNFVGLDGERLVAFMKACISPATIPEHAIPPTPPPEQAKAPTPEPLEPKASLVVSDVRVFHPGEPDSMTLILTSEKTFVVQAHFQLQGPEASSLTAQESSYEMNVYAEELASGESKLLTTYSAKLIQDVLEYKAPAEVPGLPPGLYRLFTLVTLDAPIKVVGYHDGLIIQVI